MDKDNYIIVPLVCCNGILDEHTDSCYDNEWSFSNRIIDVAGLTVVIS